MKFTGKEGLEYFAKQFINIPTEDQNTWTMLKFGISSETFRRYCKLANIKL